MDVEPIFQSAQHYPPLKWRYKCKIGFDNSSEQISQHELWLDITKIHHESMFVRQRLVDDNRLFKTITQKNASKIPKNSDIWEEEELYYGKESEMGLGLGGQDLYYLYENVNDHKDRMKTLKKGMMTGIVEEDEDLELPDLGQQLQSTAKDNDDEGAAQPGSFMLYRSQYRVGNAIMFEENPSDREQEIVAEKAECLCPEKLSWADMVADELNDQFGKDQNAQNGEDTNVPCQDAQDILSQVSETSTTKLSTKRVDDPDLTQQTSATSTQDGKQLEPEKEMTIANETADKASGQLFQRSPQSFDNDVDPAICPRPQRKICIENGFWNINLFDRRYKGYSSKRHQLDTRARSLRLDARKPLTELVPEDIKDTDNSSFVTPQQTPAQELTERLHELRHRCHDLNALRTSNQASPEIRPSLTKMLNHHLDCYSKYYNDRITLLSHFTSPRLQSAFKDGHYRRAVLYALFMDKMFTYTLLADEDPERRHWDVDQDYNELTELYHGIKRCVRGGQRERGLLTDGPSELSRSEAAASTEMEDRTDGKVGFIEGANTDAQFDAFVESVFAN